MFKNIIEDSITFSNDSTQFSSNQTEFLTKQKVEMNKDLNNWLNSKHKQTPLVLDEININDPRYYETSVILITDMMLIENRKFPSNNSTLVIDNTTKRPSISQVSQLFTLNSKQHAFFATISLSLLQLWQNRLLNNEKYQSQVVKVTQSLQKLFFFNW
jgi:hypothetical protein